MVIYTYPLLLGYVALVVGVAFAASWPIALIVGGIVAISASVALPVVARRWATR